MLEYFRLFYIERIFGPGYVATNVAYLVGAVFLLRDTRWNLRGIGEKLLECLLCFLVTTVYCSVYYQISGSGGGMLDRSMMLLFLAVYALVRSPYRPITRFVRCCVYFTVMMLALPISEPIGEAFLAVNEAWKWGEHLTSVVVVVILLATVVYLRRFSTEHLSFTPLFPAVLVGAVSAVTLFMLYMCDRADISDYSKSFKVLLAVSFLLVEVLSYYLYYIVNREYSANLELIAVQQKEDLEREQMQVSRQNYEELHAVRHDLKNQFAYLHALADGGDLDRLRRYLAELTDGAEELFSVVECGNDVINAVMNHALSLAKAAGVAVEHQIVVPPDLPYGDTELCSLLSNLMDNAIEAAQQSGEENPVVSVSIRPQQDYLFLRVTNPVDPAVPRHRRLSLKTIKENPEAHGYGTKIIRRIALENGGSVKFDMQDGRFVADVMLHLKEEQHGEAEPGDL